MPKNAPASLPPSPTGQQWTALPANTAIPIRQGYVYYVIASIKTSHTEADIRAYLAGMATVLSYSEAAPSGSYRSVTMMLQATADAPDAPWSAPWYAVGDNSSVTSGWYSPPPGAGSLPPPGGDDTTTIVVVVAGVVVVGGGAAWWWWRRKKKLAAGAGEV